MGNLKFLILLLVLVFGSKGDPLQKATRADEDYRIPATTSPERYDLTITLASNVFETNTFTGELDLIFGVTAPTRNVVLQANGLRFSAVTLIMEGNPANIDLVNATDITSDPDTDILIITTDTAQLSPNSRYQLHFEYEGLLRTDIMYGFHRSSYVENNETKYLATTQFQPTHARKAFPCFDEPSFKAVFNIKIIHPSNLNALGNTVGATVNGPSADLKTTTFTPTPKMSTYLVAFIISEFTCSPGAPLQGNLNYRVCSRPESEGLRQYAVDVGPKLLRALEDFTGIAYHSSEIGKMDQVAIPDFAAGAMENWGLVTYRETGLLWGPDESSNTFKQSIALVIAHEFTHMWFGDLVTTHWWSDTFLNEGWARYLQYISANEVEKTWELDKQIVIRSTQGILQTDALETAQALSSPAFTPSQIGAKFGGITYDKGGSIFRMVEHVMGLDNLKRGINSYLTAHDFDNTRPDDLWTALQREITQDSSIPNGVTLNQIMENWITKPYLPIVTVILEGNNITMSQARFLLSGVPSGDVAWYIPISYTISTDKPKFERTYPNQWLLPGRTLTLPNLITENDWIIINNQQTGYYRVNYVDVLWDRIAAALTRENYDGIHVLNRAQIVDDLFNLAKVGTLTYRRIFSLIEFISNDISYYPWYSATQALSHMWQRTGDGRIRAALSTHILRLMNNFIESVPFDISQDDDHIYTLKKVLALTWACRLGHAGCVANSKSAFDNYKDSIQNKPNKNLRAIVYCTALENSNSIQPDWEFLWARYNAEVLASEKATILTALGCTNNRVILEDYLSKSIDSSSGIRQQDALSVFQAVVAGSLEGVDTAIEFLKQNHATIVTYYGSMNSLTNMMNALLASFKNQEQITKLEEFLSTPGLSPDLIDVAEQAVVAAKANLNWTLAFEKQLTEYYNIKENSASSYSIHILSLALAVLMYFVL